MKRRLYIAGALLGALVLALLILRILVIPLVIESKLDELKKRTGVRVTYGSLDLGFDRIVFRGLNLYYGKESKPFAKSDAITIDPFAKKAALGFLKIDRKGVRAALRGNAHITDRAADMSFSMPPTPCADFLNAIPQAFRKDISSVKVTGKIALDIHFVLNPERPKQNLVDAELDNGCKMADFGKLNRPSTYRRPFKLRVLDERKKPYYIETGPESDNWTAFEDISRYVREAVVEAEDTLFYKHNGILLSRIKTAAEINLKRKKIRYGASTITMQTAKNLFLTREKTLARKLKELFFVWYLESNFTKDEILTLYLNIAEFGPKIYGIKAASAYYFGRAPADLDLRQAVFLAKLLPSPVKRHEAKIRGRVPKKQARRIRALLQQMIDSKRITEAERDQALSKRISFDKEDKTAEQTAPQAVMPTNLTRISRPRLKRLLPPLSKLVSDRKIHGRAL
jgi:hypothetical protein